MVSEKILKKLEIMKTNYEYKVAFTLIGGFCLPKGIESLKILSNKNVNVRFLKDADNFCFENDLGSAIGMVYLNKLYRNSFMDINKALFYQEIENIKRIRHKKVNNSTILAIKVNKTCHVDLEDVVYSDESIIISFSKVGNEKLIDANTKEIDDIICALKTNSLTNIVLEKVSEGIYFPEIDGRILFRKNLSQLDAKIFIATSITPTIINLISESHAYLTKHKDLEKTQRLFNQMLDKNHDDFKSFIFGWTALEIFLNKNFKLYNEVFIKNLTKENRVHDKIFERLNPVIIERLRLNDKFLIIASCLNHEETILEDFEIFNKIKSIRDNFFHGESKEELPINELDILLSKYLNLHIKYRTNMKHTP